MRVKSTQARCCHASGGTRSMYWLELRTNLYIPRCLVTSRLTKPAATTRATEFCRGRSQRLSVRGVDCRAPEPPYLRRRSRNCLTTHWKNRTFGRVFMKFRFHPTKLPLTLSIWRTRSLFIVQKYRRFLISEAGYCRSTAPIPQYRKLDVNQRSE